MVRRYAQQMTDIDLYLRTSRTIPSIINTSESLYGIGLPVCGTVQLLRVLVDLLGGCEATRDMAVGNSPELSYFVVLDSSECCA